MGRRKRILEIDMEEACNNWRSSRKRRTSSTHNHHHHHVPDDVLMDILCRLPAKSIFRFQTVCKHWQSLIENPVFINLHSDQAKNTRDQARFLQVQYKDPYHYFFVDESGSTTIVNQFSANWTDNEISSCNGLICYVDNRVIKVSNPLTGETMRLPKPNLGRHDCVGIGIGFGFDTNTEKYKVVVSNYLNCHPHVQVFTLGTNSWRSIPNSTKLAHLLREKAVYVKGELYWLTMEAADRYNLLSFNLGNEMLSIITLPLLLNSSGFGRDHTPFRLCEFKSCLGIYKLPDSGCKRMDFLFMKDYGGGTAWFKRQIILPFEMVSKHDNIFFLSGSFLICRGRYHSYYNCYGNQRGDVIKKKRVCGLPSDIKRVENLVESLVRLSDL